MKSLVSWPLLLFALSSHAPPRALGQSGIQSTNICFQPQEVMQMVSKREAFSKEAASCLQSYWNTHVRFYNQHKYSKYFGGRNKALDTPDKRKLIILNVLWPQLLTVPEQNAFQAEFFKDQRKDKDGDLILPGLSQLEAWMEKNSADSWQAYQQKKASLQLDVRASDESGAGGERGADKKPNGYGTLQSIGCIDMARRCLRAAFEKVGMLETFRKIDAEVVKNGVSGVVLQRALIELGWKSFYWNPDVSQNAAWDAEDPQIFPATPATATKKAVSWQGAWGAHAEHWARNCSPGGGKKDPAKKAGVMCSNEYYVSGGASIPVHDKELLVNFGQSPPAVFASVPFFLGTAHSGYHVFPGFNGQIIEAHSERGLRAKDNLEKSVFNPLAQDKQGGPRWTKIEKFRSGVIVIPPGYIENGPLKLREPRVNEAGCVVQESGAARRP
jgi:hypothetical protein